MSKDDDKFITNNIANIILYTTIGLVILSILIGGFELLK